MHFIWAMEGLNNTLEVFGFQPYATTASLLPHSLRRTPARKQYMYRNAPSLPKLTSHRRSTSPTIHLRTWEVKLLCQNVHFLHIFSILFKYTFFFPAFFSELRHARHARHAGAGVLLRGQHKSGASHSGIRRCWDLLHSWCLRFQDGSVPRTVPFRKQPGKQLEYSVKEQFQTRNVHSDSDCLGIIWNWNRQIEIHYPGCPNTKMRRISVEELELVVLSALFCRTNFALTDCLTWTVYRARLRLGNEHGLGCWS